MITGTWAQRMVRRLPAGIALVMLLQACAPGNAAPAGQTGALTETQPVTASTTASLDSAPAAAVMENRNTVPWDAQFNWPEMDSQGWAVFTPPADARIVYVSSDGNDRQGKTYSPTDVQDPFRPGQVKAFASIAAAERRLRRGKGDWLLLRRGDTWSVDAPLEFVNGQDSDRRTYYGAYGPLQQPRPEILWRGREALIRGDGHRDIALTSWSIKGVENGLEGGRGILLTPRPGTENSGLYFEDVQWQYLQLTLEGRRHNLLEQANSDIIFHRCTILDSYSTRRHAQGMFSKNSSIYVSESLADHNGWKIQKFTDKDRDASQAQATLYNHNFYWTMSSDGIVRDTLSLRSSSIGFKLTSNTRGARNQIGVRNMLFDGNVFAHGELGIAAGGNRNPGNGPRWANMLIRNNVFTEIGASRPTSRKLAWGVQPEDWQGGEISGNLFANFGGGEVVNVQGITFSVNNKATTAHEVVVKGNAFHNLVSGVGFNFSGIASSRDISISNNTFSQIEDAIVLTDDLQRSGMTGTLNRVNGTAEVRTRRDTIGMNAFSGTSGIGFVSVDTLQHPDPQRTLSAYDAHIGGAGTVDSFAQRARLQRKGNWDSRLTAQAAAQWIRAGFTMPDGD